MNKKFEKLGFYPADILLPKKLWNYSALTKPNTPAIWRCCKTNQTSLTYSKPQPQVCGFLLCTKYPANIHISLLIICKSSSVFSCKSFLSPAVSTFSLITGSVLDFLRLNRHLGYATDKPSV